jgi:hypothetical protein
MLKVFKTVLRRIITFMRDELIWYGKKLNSFMICTLYLIFSRQLKEGGLSWSLHVACMSKQTHGKIKVWMEGCNIKVGLKEVCCENVNRIEIVVGIEVLMAAGMKMAVFWVVAPCNLVEVYQCFRGTCCLHHQGDE